MQIKVTVLGLLATLTAVSCSQPNTPSSIVPAIQSTKAPTHQESVDFANIPGQFPTPPTLTNIGQAEAPVGACVNLSGPAVKAVLTIVDCGSMQNTYRVVQRVNTPKECSDTDRPYYHNSSAAGQFTACLDLAWDSSSCISLGQPVTKVACSDTAAPNRIKPVKVLLDTTGLDGCPNGGYKHPQRRFTVCTEEQK